MKNIKLLSNRDTIILGISVGFLNNLFFSSGMIIGFFALALIIVGVIGIIRDKLQKKQNTKNKP